MGQRYVFGTDRGTDRQRLTSEVKKMQLFLNKNFKSQTDERMNRRTDGERTGGQTDRRSVSRTGGRTDKA